MTSTTKPDYWALLGLNPGSDSIQLKNAFRREARKWHPDLNLSDSNAEERFKLINEAYAVLSDPRKRSAWENNQTLEFQEFDQFESGFPTFEQYLDAVLGLEIDQEENLHHEQEIQHGQEIDEDFFISSDEEKPTRSPQPPPPIRSLGDLETLVELDPEEALNGTTVEIELKEGTLVELLTPPFAGDGWRLRLPGVAPGGRDHFVQLRVETDEGLRIDGLRVLYRLELYPHDALLGCAVDIPTLSGPVTLQVPPRSSSGRLLRLRGRGLQYEDLSGDQLVEITVVIPEDPTEAEIALYMRLQELSNEQDIR